VSYSPHALAFRVEVIIDGPETPPYWKAEELYRNEKQKLNDNTVQN